jgi:pimeloyl-ACP methyl ester carboxylesterase
MIHGGSQTAANWMGTIDGREGWRSFFTVNGYEVYLVDQVGRGRSPAYNPVGPYSALDNNPAPLTTYGEPFIRPANTLTRMRNWTVPEQFLDWPQAALHTQWPSFGQPGGGRPGDPYFDQFFASQIQSRFDPTGTQTQRDAQNAGAALLDKIGPAIVFTHSQSAAQGFLIADARPNLVKALVTLETGGGRATGPTTTDWVLSAIPITYAPAVTNPATQLSFVEEPTADGPNLIRCWLQRAPARQLPNLQRTKHLLIVAQASSASQTFHCVSKYLRQAGVENTFANLGQVGIPGNSHMIMVEKNALQTAAFVATWLEDNLEKKAK